MLAFSSDFERLGNPGWNWERFNHHLAKLEGYVRVLALRWSVVTVTHTHHPTRFVPSRSANEALANSQTKFAPLQLGRNGETSSYLYASSICNVSIGPLKLTFPPKTNPLELAILEVCMLH